MYVTIPPHFDEDVREGIEPVFRNQNPLRKSVTMRVSPRISHPLNASGKTVIFYIAVVEAVKAPPIAGLSDLSERTPYVIKMDKETMTVK
ncbi:MAG: hypothetical protein NTX71_12655 [Candidatus Aureabacteria bacterium]|nr:hypothetical protein [Candidatus Auribacterota bacterium]